MARSEAAYAQHERRSESPSESTGQLTWLIFAVLVAGGPHLLVVHPWVPVIVVGITGWRMLAAIYRWHLPSAWIRVPLTLLGFFGILASYRQISGLGAGSALLLVMISMKLLETRGHRDRAVVIFICYFLLFAAFLREQAIWSSAYLLTGVLVTTAALYQTSRSGSVVPAPRAMAMAVRLVVQAVPLMLLLFFLFPRVPGPFWAMPSGNGQGVTGLSNRMTPGDITELTLSDKVAFRVRFDDVPPKQSELYWRGPVMTRFDGRTWGITKPEKGPEPDVKDYATGRSFDYEITLEPHGSRWLLALDIPVSWTESRAIFSTDSQLLSKDPVTQRIAYRSRSYTGAVIPAQLDAESRLPVVRLPEDSNPQTLKFAQELRAESASDREYLNKILRHYRQQEFYYTLTPPTLGTNPVDEFMFGTRRGFCGHFASAFAVLARSAGIPARVVTGYQGAEFNPVGEYWIVRQSDAHAWVEIWLDNRWERFDPTAAVAPERIERGFGNALTRRGAGDASLLGAGSFISRLAQTWDAMNAGWNRWVLNFGPKSQTTILNLAGIERPSARHLIIAMTVSVSLFLIILGLIQRRSSRPPVTRLQRVYATLCSRTGKATRNRQPCEGPEEYSQVVSALRPDLAPQFSQLVQTYVRLRYDEHSNDADVETFRRAVNGFKPRPA
jgi:transglutaminase-like putative cysteine protease